LPGYTYDRQYRVHHMGAGDVTLPDQVFEHMALWDRADMPFPALDRAGRSVEIKLCDTDA
jgi:hypothetical protein